MLLACVLWLFSSSVGRRMYSELIVCIWDIDPSFQSLSVGTTLICCISPSRVYIMNCVEIRLCCVGERPPCSYSTMFFS